MLDPSAVVPGEEATAAEKRQSSWTRSGSEKGPPKSFTRVGGRNEAPDRDAVRDSMRMARTGEVVWLGGARDAGREVDAIVGEDSRRPVVIGVCVRVTQVVVVVAFALILFNADGGTCVARGAPSGMAFATVPNLHRRSRCRIQEGVSCCRRQRRVLRYE